MSTILGPLSALTGRSCPATAAMRRSSTIRHACDAEIKKFAKEHVLSAAFLLKGKHSRREGTPHG